MHTVTPPPAILNSTECACILINTTSYLPNREPNVAQLVFHVKNLTAPNSLFAEAAIINSVRDYGLLDTDIKVAKTRLLHLDFTESQVEEIIRELTSYIDGLFPAEGI